MSKSKRSPQSIIIFLLLLVLAYVLADLQKEPVNMPVHTDGLSVHFIDVGQADCALLLCGDEAMLIDGGNVADSDLVYAYLQKYNVSKEDLEFYNDLKELKIGDKIIIPSLNA